MIPLTLASQWVSLIHHKTQKQEEPGSVCKVKPASQSTGEEKKNFTERTVMEHEAILKDIYVFILLPLLF